MRVIGLAAIVSGLIAAPVSAIADETIVATLSVTVEPTGVPNLFSSPLSGVGFQFPLFNPSLGTLDSVSVMLSGDISWVSFAQNPIVGFFVDYEGNSVAGQDFHLSTGTPTILINLSGSTSFSNDLNGFLGTGTGRFDFVAFTTDLPDNTVTIESVGPLTGSITYDYTPNGLALAPSVPETSTWAMMLIGFAGLGFAGRSARRVFVNRTRSAGVC